MIQFSSQPSKQLSINPQPSQTEEMNFKSPVEINYPTFTFTSTSQLNNDLKIINNILENENLKQLNKLNQQNGYKQLSPIYESAKSIPNCQQNDYENWMGSKKARLTTEESFY
ncbi:hypothetical protein HELRODRAFT_177404 [Helobdella robusta]|uniref:Uncharacterized protein n=1 Tax=Helobdella robusta TaxID=6412 RepID=T1FBM9_HELRO|nr:hypothetical protein HELRODRAFT_177404 [Helobdella robusta]ESN98161.1 hypothetical protein HELRODRAFT_177404 [Helobdella robusta]